jgi:hypothetical protein
VYVYVYVYVHYIGTLYVICHMSYLDSVCVVSIPVSSTKKTLKDIKRHKYNKKKTSKDTLKDI